MCFNPRARDGRELIGVFYYLKFEVSIHAPVMDANLLIGQTRHACGFQSTRP